MENKKQLVVCEHCFDDWSDTPEKIGQIKTSDCGEGCCHIFVDCSHCNGLGYKVENDWRDRALTAESELETLRANYKTLIELWEPVDKFVRPLTPLGHSVCENALALLAERKAMMEQEPLGEFSGAFSFKDGRSYFEVKCFDALPTVGAKLYACPIPVQSSSAVAVPELTDLIETILDINNRVNYSGKRGEISTVAKLALKLLSTPTPPSSEQEEWVTNGCGEITTQPISDFLQNGTRGIEQPDSEALDDLPAFYIFPEALQHIDAKHGTMHCIYNFQKAKKYDAENKTIPVYLRAPLSHKPQRITEQDAREIATQFFYWWHNTPGTNTMQGFDEWINGDGNPLLAKLNEHREPDYKAQRDELIKVLTRVDWTPLDAWHSSELNVLVRTTLDKYESITQCEGKGEV